MTLPKLEIITPEQVLFRYETAGLVTRMLAWLLDYTLIVAGYIAIVLVCSMLGQVAFIFILLGMFILDFGYFTYFETRSAGQTPGKRLFSLRVISIHGTRIRFADALMRNLLRPIDNLPWIMVVGGTVAFFDRHHRRLGDMAAETVVVREVRRALPQALTVGKERLNTFQSNRSLQQRILNRITRDDRDLILDLAIRRDQLDPEVREELFAAAAMHYRNQFSLPLDLDHLSDEQTIMNLALLIQDAKFTG